MVSERGWFCNGVMISSAEPVKVKVVEVDRSTVATCVIARRGAEDAGQNGSP